MLTFYRSSRCVTDVKKKVEDRSRWPAGKKRYSEGEYCHVYKGSGVVMEGGQHRRAARQRQTASVVGKRKRGRSVLAELNGRIFSRRTRRR